MTYLYEIIWPNRRKLTENQVNSMYLDAVANDELDADDTDLTNVHDRVKALHDAGLITLRKKVPIACGE